MLRRQPAARLGLVHISALRDTHHRIVGLEDISLGKVDIICGHQRQAQRVSQFHMAAFAELLRFRQPTLTGMALQFHIQTVRVNRRQRLQQRLRLWHPGRTQMLPHRPVWPTRQAYQPVRVPLQLGQRHVWRCPVPTQIQRRVQLHQMLIPAPILRQQHHSRRGARLFSRRRDLIFQVDLATHNRLHPRPRSRFGKFERTEHVVCIGDRHRRHSCVSHHSRQLLHLHRPFQQRIFGVKAQVDESRCFAHKPDATPSHCAGKGPPYWILWIRNLARRLSFRRTSCYLPLWLTN